MSRAVGASLEMLSPQKTEFDVVPCGFTQNVTGLEGEVFYDALCEKERLTYQEQAERFSSPQRKPAGSPARTFPSFTMTQPMGTSFLSRARRA